MNNEVSLQAPQDVLSGFSRSKHGLVTVKFGTKLKQILSFQKPR